MFLNSLILFFSPQLENCFQQSKKKSSNIFSKGLIGETVVKMVVKCLDFLSNYVYYLCFWSLISCVFLQFSIGSATRIPSVMSVAWSLHVIGKNVEEWFKRVVTTSIETSGLVLTIVFWSSNDLRGFQTSILLGISSTRSSCLCPTGNPC